MCVHGVIKLNTRSQILGGGGPFYLCGVITVVGKGKMERRYDGDLGFWVLGCFCQPLTAPQCSGKQSVERAMSGKCPSFITTMLWYQAPVRSSGHMSVPPWTTPLPGRQQLSTKNQGNSSR